nr:hypothetical protein BaRGS_034805 [Batillaria attramentaria]
MLLLVHQICLENVHVLLLSQQLRLQAASRRVRRASVSSTYTESPSRSGSPGVRQTAGGEWGDRRQV